MMKLNYQLRSMEDEDEKEMVGKLIKRTGAGEEKEENIEFSRELFLRFLVILFLDSDSKGIKWIIPLLLAITISKYK